MKTKKSPKILSSVLCTVLCLFVICGCRQESSIQSETNENNRNGIEFTVKNTEYPISDVSNFAMSAELSKNYENFRQLYDDTKYIVAAKVIKSDKTYKSETSPIEYTASEIQITESFKGDLQIGATIEVQETGKHLSGRDVAIEGVPLLNKDMNVILFLDCLEENNTYWINGVYIGKYIFDDNNRIHHFSEMIDSHNRLTEPFITQNKTKTASGWTLDEFKQKLDECIVKRGG